MSEKIAGTIRITVDMSEKGYDILAVLSKTTKRSKADILCLGIVMVDVAVTAVKNDEHIGIVADAAKLDKEIIGIFG